MFKNIQRLSSSALEKPIFLGQRVLLNQQAAAAQRNGGAEFSNAFALGSIINCDVIALK